MLVLKGQWAHALLLSVCVAVLQSSGTSLRASLNMLTCVFASHTSCACSPSYVCQEQEQISVRVHVIGLHMYFECKVSLWHKSSQEVAYAKKVVLLSDNLVD